MAMTYVFEVKDNGTATIKKIGDEFSKLSNKAKITDGQIEKLAKSIASKFTISTLGVKAFGALTSEILSLGKEMVNNYDSANKLSQNIGIAADSVLGLRHAAELSGVGAEAMDKNLAKLSKTISDAASGSKQASDAFGKMGINVKNADGTVKNSEKVLMEMADAFQKLPDGAQKATLAMDVFGKSGASMVSMLKGGSGELQNMTNEGKAFAGNTEAVAEAMEKVKDASVRAKADIMGMIAALADTAPFKSFIGYLDDLGKKLGEAAQHKKIMRELDTQNAQADLKLLQIQEARLRYSDLEAGEKLKHIVTTQKQIDVLQEKLKLDNDELTLMKAKTNVAMLEKKQNLNYKEERDLSVYKSEIKAINDKREAAAKAAADEAKAVADYEKNQKALADAEKAREEARKKSIQMYEAETKRLNDWLTSYEKSKLTERQLAEYNYNQELENFKALNERKILIGTAYDTKLAIHASEHSAKLKEITDKENEERLKAAEEAKNKEWDLRRIAAKNYSDIAAIEEEQIKAKYDKEIKLAGDSLRRIALLEQAKAVELEAIKQKSIENEKQRQELLRSYRETAAKTEEERIAIQMESLNAKYAAEIEKAGRNKDMILEIERAKNAEIERMETQLTQMRIAQGAQYVDSAYQVANAIAVLGKAGGDTMKKIATGQAIINTAVAATKAATAAPYPLNAVLVAGAIAQGVTQLATIKAQHFYRGGMIPGSNTLIMANEQGREAILNTRAVREVGGEAGVNALNRGTSNTYNNSRSNTVNVNISTSIMTQKAFKDEIEPVLKRAERRR
ncbi:MAG: hypothetical protein LBC75_04800 [Fibromonadaceae bacterium]|jgi:DNA repair exonuclease SbcCD ATPase subunit|nr:hypothetical protein [Fibromonadaceae bacterium]